MTDSEKLAREIWEWAFDEEGNMSVTILEFREHIAEAIRTNANAKVEEAAKMVENPDYIHLNIDDFAALIRSLKE
jgi:hypothetical protein